MAQDTIERMLNRCKLIQDTLHANRPTKHIGSSSQPICRGSGGSGSNGSHRGLQPCTPPLRPASTPHRKQKADNMYLAGRSQLLFEAPGSACSTPCSSTSAADAVQQQDGQRGAWCGCVDLNPGFTFRPGKCFAVLRKPDGVRPQLQWRFCRWLLSTCGTVALDKQPTLGQCLTHPQENTLSTGHVLTWTP